MKESMMGEKNPFYGRKHSAETRARLSVIAQARVLSEETKHKISEAERGANNHMYGKSHTLATRLKISKSKKGCRGARLGCHHTDEAKAKLRQFHLGTTASEETKRKMGLARVGNQNAFGHRDDSESRERKRQAAKLHWQNPSYRESVIKNSRASANIHPNKPESLVLSMLNEIAPNEWAFVGDGQLIIGGKNPDMANVNGGKALVEIFGDYWHGERARCYEETEEGRIALFKKYGYRTLVIWENELKHPEKVLVKIREFVRK